MTRSSSREPAHRRFRTLALLFVWLIGVIQTALHAAPVPSNKPAHYPDWWFVREVIKRTNPNDPAQANPIWPNHYPAADDYAVANLGQVKAIASKAAAELDATLPGGAGADIRQLVASFAPGGNLTLVPWATATQSSTGLGLNAQASRAIDGTTNGNFWLGSVTHTDNDVTAWWQVDLGASQMIGEVEVWNRTDCCGDRTNNFYVLISETDMSGRSLADLLADANVWKSPKVTTPPNPNTTIWAGNQTGRYVMVRLEGQQYLHLAEVKVKAPSTGATADDFAAATVGQLKALSKPFHDRLIAVHWEAYLPWTSTTTDDDSYSVANLGQTKSLFSVDFTRDSDGDSVTDLSEGILDQTDTDGDTVPDYLDTDSDNDGLDDRTETTGGTSRTAADTDTDGVADRSDVYPTDARRTAALPRVQYVALDISRPFIGAENVLDVAIGNDGRIAFLWFDDVSQYQVVVLENGNPTSTLTLDQYGSQLIHSWTAPIDPEDEETIDLHYKAYVEPQYGAQRVNSLGHATITTSAGWRVYRKVEPEIDGEDPIIDPDAPDSEYPIFVESDSSGSTSTWTGGPLPAPAIHANGHVFWVSFAGINSYLPGRLTNADVFHAYDYDYDYFCYIGGTQFGANGNNEFSPGYISTTGKALGTARFTPESDYFKACWFNGFFQVFNGFGPGDYFAISDNAEVFGYSPQIPASAVHADPTALHYFLLTGGDVQDFYSLVSPNYKNHIAFHSPTTSAVFNGSGHMLFSADVGDIDPAGNPINRNGVLLWKPGGELVEAVGGVVPTNQDRFSNSGQVVETRFEYNPPPGESLYSYATLLVPMEVVSRDKFLAGSITIPQGFANLKVEFAGPGENLGSYSKLLGGGTTKIYDRVEDILSDSDIAAGIQPASQKVWFVRDSVDSSKINFYTCFNGLGEVQLKIYLNESSTTPAAIVSHTLTAAEDFAETIDYVDAWVKGTSFTWAGGGQALTFGLEASTQSFLSGAIDNLTRACLIPFFNVINQVEGLSAVAFGLFDGVKSGLQDDWRFVVSVVNGAVEAGNWALQRAQTELLQWQADPIKRALELKQMADRFCESAVFQPLASVVSELSSWEGFKKRAWPIWDTLRVPPQRAYAVSGSLVDAIKDGLLDWGQDFGNRMLAGAEKTQWQSLAFLRDKLGGPGSTIERQMGYTFGYVFGYLAEQVVVGVLTDVVIRIGQVVVKGGISLASSLARRTAAMVAARAQMLKRFMNEAGQLPVPLMEAYQRGLVLASTGPTGEGMPRLAMEMMQEAADAGKLVWLEYVDNIVGGTNIRQLVKQGGEGVIERRFAQLMHLLGDDFSLEIGRNFLKVADEVIIVRKADGTVDEFFEAFYRAFTGNPSQLAHADAQFYSIVALPTEGKAALKKFLSDPNPGKLWDTFEETTFFNNRVRGVLAELCIYKRHYKGLGYKHAPNAAGYDFYDPVWVQIKTTSSPATAYQRMKTALDDLVAESPSDKPLLLHILVREENAVTNQLKSQLNDYIDTLPPDVKSRFQPVKIEAFELTP